MADDQWDLSGGARRALQGIVADSHYGVGALSQPAVMSNLLKDLLPDEPRESSLLVAAAQADLVGTLHGYLAQGMDLGTAARLTASGFVATTPHSHEASSWVVNELALALGMGQATRTASQDTVAAPIPQQYLAAPGFNAVAAAQPIGPAAQPPQVFANPGPFQAGPVQPGPAQAGPVQPGPAQPLWTPPPAPAAGDGRGTLIAAGIAGLAGVLFILLGSVVPFIKYPGTAGSDSVFGGYTGSPAGVTFWYAIEPGMVAAACLVLAIMLLVNRRASLLVSGMLIGFGIECTLLFAGYSFAIYAPDKHEAGGPLGLIGGLAILVAGLISYRYQRSRQSAGLAISPAPPGFSPRPY